MITIQKVREESAIMDQQKEKTPYIIRITETFTKTVVVWAETECAARDLAESLCNTEDIDVCRNGFSGREIRCNGVCSPAEVHDYYEYER